MQRTCLCLAVLMGAVWGSHAAFAFPVYVEGPDHTLHQVTSLHHQCLRPQPVVRAWWDLFVPLSIKCGRSLLRVVAHSSLACFQKMELTLDSGEVLTVSSASPMAEYLAAATVHPENAAYFFDVPSDENLAAVLLLSQQNLIESREITPVAVVAQFESGKVRSRSLILGSRGRYGLERGIYTGYFERRIYGRPAKPESTERRLASRAP